MTIHNYSGSNRYYPTSATGPSTETNRGVGGSLWQAYNSVLPGMFSWGTGIAGGVIMALPSYLARSAISSSVERLNLSLLCFEIGSRNVLNELLYMGTRYGAAGGVITGLSAALLLNQCIKISNRSQYYDQPRDLLMGLGGALGLVVGGLAGAVYSISLHSQYADFYTHEYCHNHATYNNKLMIDD